MSHLIDAYDSLEDAIAILQCVEDASNESHIQTATGIAIGMLLSAARDIDASKRELPLEG